MTWAIIIGISATVCAHMGQTRHTRHGREANHSHWFMRQKERASEARELKWGMAGNEMPAGRGAW